MNHPWRPTPALVRAGLASMAGAVAAVLLGRPDLLVLAVPLAVCAAGAVLSRPARPPRAATDLVHPSVREGEGTLVRARLTGAEDVEHAVVALTRHRFLAYRPATGVHGVTVPGGAPTVTWDVPVGSLHWGRRLVGDGLVSALTPWAGYRWGPVEVLAQSLLTLPTPGRFDARSPAPHPIGLVGTHPARRQGEGGELATIRPFAPGDRLRRVQWRVSLRTGTLHVTSTLAEEDSSILLVVDAVVDLGVGRGIHGSASSLDVAVRAAGAVAEHYLRRGDRVGLRVLGTARHGVLPMGAGTRHLRKLLDTLAQVTPGAARLVDLTRLRFGLAPGTVAIVLSPMLSEEAIGATLSLASGGVTVVVVDTVPEDLDLGDDDPALHLAWRMRLLEREDLLRQVEAAGIPVVRWRGPGTLDEVLRGLGRRAAAPRMVRR